MISAMLYCAMGPLAVALQNSSTRFEDAISVLNSAKAEYANVDYTYCTEKYQ